MQISLNPLLNETIEQCNCFPFFIFASVNLSDFNDISMSCIEIGTVGFSVTKQGVRKKLAALLTYAVHAFEAACIIQLPVEGGVVLCLF